MRHQTYTRWTKEDDTELERLYFAGKDMETIAHALRKTPSACHARGAWLSLARRKRRGRHKAKSS